MWLFARGPSVKLQSEGRLSDCACNLCVCRQNNAIINACFQAKKSVFIIGATNRTDIIDTALMRPVCAHVYLFYVKERSCASTLGLSFVVEHI